MTHDELLALPPVLDVPTAGRVLGVGRSLAYPWSTSSMLRSSRGGRSLEDGRVPSPWSTV